MSAIYHFGANNLTIGADFTLFPAPLHS